MCFVWISEQTAIISLYNINLLVCITEAECNKLTKDRMCLFETQKVTQFYNWSNNDINIKCNNSRLNKALHQTTVGREVLTGELCAVQMGCGRLNVAFWRSECGASELETALTVLRDWQVEGKHIVHWVFRTYSVVMVFVILHWRCCAGCIVCVHSAQHSDKLPVVCDAPHRLYQGAVYSINTGTLHRTHGNVISFTPLKICALSCHDFVKFSNAQQRYCQVCCAGSESKRRIKAGSRIEAALLPSVTAAVLAAPICADRTFSRSISVDSCLKDLKHVG